MTVLDWLYVHRHTQVSLAKEMRNRGHSTAPCYLSQLLRGVVNMSENSKLKIRDGLRGLGATEADLATMAELAPAAAEGAADGQASN